MQPLEITICGDRVMGKKEGSNQCGICGPSCEKASFFLGFSNPAFSISAEEIETGLSRDAPNIKHRSSYVYVHDDIIGFYVGGRYEWHHERSRTINYNLERINHE